jgi:hypothetical protein
MAMTETLTSIDAACTRILERCGERIVLATPLGLGKPNTLLNAIYSHVVQHPDTSLEILTALSLARPTPKPGLEARFAEPFLARQFGGDYPDLAYVRDRQRRALPDCK